MIGPVRDRATFAALATGRRASCGPVRVRYVHGSPQLPDGPRTDAGSTRVAYAINRKVGTAVVRNRVRRRLRAALVELDRPDGPGIPHGAYLFSAGPSVADLPFAEVKRLVGCVVERVSRRG